MQIFESESLDKVYDTIELNIETNGNCIATFHTDVDEYTISISPPIKKGTIDLEQGEVFYYPGVCEISFSRKTFGNGANLKFYSSDIKNLATTILKCLEQYIERTKYILDTPIFGFCTEFLDTGIKRKVKRAVYKLLYGRLVEIGFQQVQGKLCTLRTDMYEKIKKNDVLLNGQIYEPVPNL